VAAAAAAGAAGVGSPLATQGSGMVAAAAGAAAASPGCFVGGLGLGVAANLMIASMPGGPVQLTAAAAGLLGDIEKLIQATQQSGGQRVSVGGRSGREGSANTG
jgi:hypothetical protein